MKAPVPPEEEASFQMAPMIDMVFLLLIFFMCASHLSVMQHVPLEIPTASKAVVPKDRPDRFVVNITEEGTLYGGSQEVSLEELKTLVRETKDANPAVRIYLRADQKAEHKHIRKVMAAMGEMGIDDFIFGAFIPGN